MKKHPKQKTSQARLEDFVKAAHEAGVHVTVSLEPRQMPQRFHDDPEAVTMMIAESERCNALGQRWMNAEKPNPVAAEAAFLNGWAYALAAAWLRCKLKGELTGK